MKELVVSLGITPFSLYNLRLALLDANENRASVFSDAYTDILRHIYDLGMYGFKQELKFLHDMAFYDAVKIPTDFGREWLISYESDEATRKIIKKQAFFLFDINGRISRKKFKELSRIFLDSNKKLKVEFTISID